MKISHSIAAAETVTLPPEQSTPLSSLPAGAQGVLLSLHGGHHFCSRLANLGFTTGALIVVVQNYGHGPMLVSLRGTLVALGRREAAHIFISKGEAS